MLLPLLSCFNFHHSSFRSTLCCILPSPYTKLSKLSMFPISFYQGNPEVACLTLSRPDREEREKMLEKIESGFEVKLKPGESLLTCDKKNEYIDMLDDFTNREIIQMARLSRKEGKMPFEQLYFLSISN